MKIFTISLISASLTVGAGLPALAQSTNGAPMQATFPSTPTSSPSAAVAPAGQTKKNDPNQRVICKTQDEVGTRLGGKRICMTKAQWDQQTLDARDSVDNIQRTPRG
ncbi:MAG TPA: hypothetical protein VH353_07140 [Caulobacteraceae bacterium]|jgi:hypothetical protein|nr:hypothetical protein [Caulobacteraceae bacterium]